MQAMEEQKQNKKESIADASQKISDNKEACKSHSSVFFSKALSSAEPFQSPLYIRARASSKHRTV